MQHAEPTLREILGWTHEQAIAAILLAGLIAACITALKLRDQR